VITGASRGIGAASALLLAKQGFAVVDWVGDHFQALVSANERALQSLTENPSRAVDYVAWFLDRLTREEAQRYYERYVGPYFVPGRKADLTAAQQAIDAVASELGVAPAAADAMYELAGQLAQQS
jgi:NAD(P)-dependent dehydrogenase (short-subunit alcohol dehydrogenase family)